MYLQFSLFCVLACEGQPCGSDQIKLPPGSCCATAGECGRGCTESDQRFCSSSAGGTSANSAWRPGLLQVIFPSASRQCLLLEMVLGKHMVEPAIKINFHFNSLWSASVQVQILVLLLPAWCCAAGRLAKRQLCGYNVGKLRERPVLTATLACATQVGCRQRL